MLRSCSILISAALCTALSGAARAAVTVFQDPGNTGVPAASPATIIVGGPDVSLNLWYLPGSTPSGSNPCLSGLGDEVCGWDFHVGATGGVVLETFTADTQPGSDIVAAISGNVLRANGGNPITGEIGPTPRRIGTLVVSATAVGSVTVVGNLIVTAALAAAPVGSQPPLATASVGGPDTDLDTVEDLNDNCVTVGNTDQADGDGDLVGDLCDNCTTIPNPREAAGFVGTNAWATLTGGQRDDDHDGFGNKCDAKFPGVTGTFVGTNDLTQFRASNTKSRTGDTCGTTGVRPCAIYDLDQTGTFIGSGDLTVFRALNTKTPGPKCAACTGAGSVPLPCETGTAGTCF